MRLDLYMTAKIATATGRAPMVAPASKTTKTP